MKPVVADPVPSSPDAHVAERAKRRRSIDRWATRAAVGAAISFVFATSLVAASNVLISVTGEVKLAASLVVLAGATVGILAAGEYLRDVFFWRRPTRRLARLINELRAGEAPLAELDAIGGGPGVLVEPLRSILLDLREAKRENARLAEEMRTRILNRTDALERQLGAMKQQADRDPLTGLNNRRALDAMLPQVVAACRGASQDVCVLMIDVDNFKALNDTLGHAAGDEMLRSIAEVMRSSIREHDAAFRPGGDEFVVLLPRAARPIGERLGARLASLVDHMARPMRLARPPALSVGSASLSELPTGAGVKELLALADRRLYDAKAAKPGRATRGAA